MSPDKGIRLGVLRASDLSGRGLRSKPPGRFRWYYLGAEFCENLLDPGLAEEAARLSAAGGSVCVMTPMLTDKGLAETEKLFSRLAGLRRAGRLGPDTEVTINDFGALKLARAMKLPFALSAGRLLSDCAFEQRRGELKAANASTLDFFAGLGVRRFEISAPGGKLRARFEAAAGRRFALTLHYPYMNLASTRTCMVGMPYVPPEESPETVNCRQECLICAFTIRHPGVKEPLTVRGNTVFLEFPEKFFSSGRELSALRVDRLIWSPRP